MVVSELLPMTSSMQGTVAAAARRRPESSSKHLRLIVANCVVRDVNAVSRAVTFVSSATTFEY